MENNGKVESSLSRLLVRVLETVRRLVQHCGLHQVFIRFAGDLTMLRLNLAKLIDDEHFVDSYQKKQVTLAILHSRGCAAIHHHPDSLTRQRTALSRATIPVQFRFIHEVVIPLVTSWGPRPF